MAKMTDYFNKPLNLLPNYFKKIGLGFILATVVFFISIKILGINFTAEKKEMLKTILSDAFLFGMVIVAFSKDKDEDELSMQIRLKALGTAFVSVVMFKITRDVFSFVLQEPIETMKGDFNLMMFWYFTTYYAAKRRR